jgi:hypothetical protein
MSSCTRERRLAALLLLHQTQVGQVLEILEDKDRSVRSHPALNRSATVHDFTCKSFPSANHNARLCLGNFSHQRVFNMTSKHGLEIELVELEEVVGERTAIRWHYI